jgi:hypothetical protein
MHRRREDIGSAAPDVSAAGLEPNPALERLADLERRSLLAEQARQLAHRLRSPLSIIGLIAETLQLERQDDANRADRLARIQAAAGSLAAELADVVESTHFGYGPRRRLAPATLAADVIRAFGGEVLTAPMGAAGEHAMALVEPASLAAALVHMLRLLGVGTDYNGVCAQRPVLRAESRNGELLLAISVIGAEPPDTPRERADLRLMAKAAERVANDHGGTLTLGPDSATLRLSLADVED